MRRHIPLRLQSIALACLPVLAWLTPASATPALVVDVATSQVLHAEDAGDPWYPASTTKLMTAFVVFEALRAGEVGLDTPVVMSRHAMSQASLHAGLRVGRTMTLEDALFAAIAGSANEVAVALAETVAGGEAAFVGRMNEAAKRLGMTGSRFANPNGLGDRSQRVTARDLALLGLAIERTFPEHQRFFRAGGIIVDGKEIASYNELLSRFPGTIGMKTGFLCLSGRNIVALAERGDRRVMVVLLGATTERERAERAAKLLTEAFKRELPVVSPSVEAVANDSSRFPEDMRLRICSDRSAAYEAEREALYPMGLPGQESYLGPTQSVTMHQITTWTASATAAAPLPTPRPQRR